MCAFSNLLNDGANRHCLSCALKIQEHAVEPSERYRGLSSLLRDAGGIDRYDYSREECHILSRLLPGRRINNLSYRTNITPAHLPDAI